MIMEVKEESIEERLEKIKTANVQEIWSNIAETCVKVAEDVVRRKKGEKKSENKEFNRAFRKTEIHQK